MGKEKFIDQTTTRSNIKKLQTFLNKEKLEAFYLSSSDIFLNEYVPLEDCHRYYVTNFTGSTAEVLVPVKGKVQLFVDGRYYEQADLECDLEVIEVQKVPYGVSIQEAMMTWIKDQKVKKMGLEADRTDLFLAKKFEAITQVKKYFNGELTKVIDFHSPTNNGTIQELDISLVGESTFDKLKKFLKPGEAFFISQLDSIAWLTNTRRYELPFQSTFRAKALATYERVYLLMENLEGNFENEAVEVMVGEFHSLEKFLQNIKFYETECKVLLGEKSYKFETIYFSDRTINASDFEKLTNFFGAENCVNKSEGLVPFHANKNAVELLAMESSFNRADQAIFNTILWTKEQVKKGQRLTEMQYYHKCNEFYKETGAFSQSFNTIAAFGSNSSIIHFSSPSDEIVFKENEMVLLDSGGYYESGYATDTTRTFLSGGKASDKQKEIYTLVLKGLLHGLNAVFPEGTWGSVVDGVVRQPLFQYGQNYAHGTGHGVGINVHEGGFRLSTTSNIPLKEGTVGSIEPGIYIPGFGGVRLENVVAVEKHPTFPKMLRFKNLVFVGFDHDLIDYELLTDQERDWLDQYEKECQEKNRSLIYK